jgi:hypothetical protein
VHAAKLTMKSPMAASCVSNPACSNTVLHLVSAAGSNYMSYTLWQAVTNFATTANGVLASTFLAADSRAYLTSTDRPVALHWLQTMAA